MEIKEIGVIEYFILLSHCRTQLSDFYVKSIGLDIHILGAWEEEDKGFLLYEQKGTFAEVLYLGCVENDVSIEQKLLEEFLKLRTEHSIEHILFRMMEESTQHQRLQPFMEKNGFIVKRKMYLFQSDMRDYIYWKQYRSRHGEKVLRFLELEGFETIPFSEVSDVLLKEVAYNPNGEFEKVYNPFRILQGKKGKFCSTISHLSLKEGHPVAYCLVTNPSEGNYVFEIISAAELYQNTGVIFQSFCLAMDALEHQPCKRVVFAMDAENKRALALTNRILNPLIQQTKMQYDYEYDYKVKKETERGKKDE